MSLKHKLFSGFVWSLIDKLVNQLGVLAVTLYISRMIGPESFGLIGMLIIFIALADSVINNGFSQALVQKSHSMTEQDASTIFYVNLVWGFFIYAVLYLFAPLIAQFYHQPPLLELGRLIFVIIIINSLTVVSKAKLIIQVDFKSQAIANTIGTVIAAILAIYLAEQGYNYWSFAWFLIVRALITNIFLYYFSKWLPQFTFNKQSFKSLFKFGSNLMIAGLVATLVNNLYVLLIGRYFSAKQVGYFTQANNLSLALGNLISSTLQGVTFPIMTSIKDDREQLITIYKQLISITMMFTLPIFIGFAAVADDFVDLVLGNEWRSIIPYLITLSIARSIQPISAINMNILNAIGRSDYYLKTDLVKIPISLACLFVGLQFGTQGVIFGILVSIFISFFINCYYPYMIFKYGAIKQLLVAKNYIFASIIMFFSIQLIDIHSLIIELILKIFSGIVIYFICLIVLKDVFFLRILKQLLSRITKKSA